ncbi:MAG: hypothetical protein GOMPHAMPRED_002916 [Gomphillus americanus]|uniref:SMP domain-containing protein n=1 Tax=Gomphillus americanus TaxID=1940652 RepID=A0A8H3I626_9LECA|nr:MAG: hypothetical protein GOMPHAMPRED_002916 [Gomphillus americanus]
MPNGKDSSSGAGHHDTGRAMTKSDSSRVQSSQAKGGKDMSSSGFAARAQSAGDRNGNIGSSTNQSNADNKGSKAV